MPELVASLGEIVAKRQQINHSIQKQMDEQNKKETITMVDKVVAKLNHGFKRTLIRGKTSEQYGTVAKRLDQGIRANITGVTERKRPMLERLNAEIGRLQQSQYAHWLIRTIFFI